MLITDINATTLEQRLSSNLLWYLIIIGAGIVLRILFIHNGGLWLDEIWSMRTSAPEQSFTGIVQACMGDTHPPLFDLLLNAWLKIFPGELSGRYLSMVIGVGGIAVTWYYTFRITQSKWAAFLAVGLISFNFFHVYYSAESRFYSLLYLLSLVLMCNVYLYSRTSHFKNLFWAGLSGVLIVYTHYYGSILLFVIASLVFLLFVLREITLRQFLTIAGVFVVVLAIYAPWLPYMLGNKSLSSWMEKPSIGTFFEYFYLYTGKNPLETAFMLVALIGSFGFWKRNRKLVILFAGTILLGYLIPFAVSHLSLPMLHNRYTIIYFPAIVMLTAIFWAEVSWLKGSWRWALPLLVFLSALINIGFVNKSLDNSREPWREIALGVAAQNRNMKLPVYAESRFWINYYLNKNESDTALLPEEFKGEEKFWYVKTPFDAQGASNSFFGPTTVIKSYPYPKNFELQLVSKTPASK